MIEYHGWVVVHESFNEKRESDERLNHIWQLLSSKVERLQKSLHNVSFYLSVHNGMHNLSLSGCNNYKSSNFEKILSL